jgi:glycosyltransferase involved in cell wall biosynthesis
MIHMKVLFICADLGIPVLGRKGAAVHVRSLVAALEREGHTVVLATPSAAKSRWEEPARPPTSLLTLPPGDGTVEAVVSLKEMIKRLGVTSSLPSEIRRLLYDEEIFPRLLRRFKDDPPDIVYERGSIFSTAGARLASALGRPFLLELNAPLSLEQSTYRGGGLAELAAAAEKWTLTRADAVLTVSALLAEHAISLGVPAERVHVLPNGVDAALFCPGPPRPATRARWGIGDGPLLGFVGGLRPWHGVDALPPLFERLAPRYEGLQMVIVGAGPLEGTLRSDFERRGLESRTVFTGAVPQEEVPPLLREFDVALAPYPKPDHAFYFSPLKLFEYMACGAAIVAPALGQIADVVRDGENGLLCPPGDLDALEAACDRLLSEPLLRRRLGEAAAKEMRARYTWDINARRVAEIGAGILECFPRRT